MRQLLRRPIQRLAITAMLKNREILVLCWYCMYKLQILTTVAMRQVALHKFVCYLLGVINLNCVM